MSAEIAPEKRKSAIGTDGEAYKAYCRYCPDHTYAWDHLSIEERLAWRHVAQAMPEEDKIPVPEQPKVKSLGQIAYEGADHTLLWEESPIFRQETWERGAQAVAVAVLHMRYDEFTPELRAAAEEGTRRGAEWLEKSEGEQPAMQVLQASPNTPRPAVGIVPHHGYRWKVTGSSEEWIAEEVKAD